MTNEIVLPSYAHIVFEEGNKALFEIGGLHPGYGHTIGNSLRRVLLSSLEGSAVTSVKIEGVNHEFSTIPGIKEDVLTILLNLKQVRFRILSDEPQIAYIEVKSEREVTAADIKTPTQLEVVDESVHVASITSKDTELKVEIEVGKGLGYVPREELQKSKVDIGVLSLDAVYSPIRRVNYEVENMRVGKRTDYNKLRIFIETDGTITPTDALLRSIGILDKQLHAVEQLSKKPEVIEEQELVISDKESGIDVETQPVDHTSESIDVLELSDRVGSILLEANVKTVGDLTKKSADEVRAISGVGAVALQEIRRSLGRLGLVLGE